MKKFMIFFTALFISVTVFGMETINNTKIEKFDETTEDQFAMVEVNYTVQRSNDCFNKQWNSIVELFKKSEQKPHEKLAAEIIVQTENLVNLDDEIAAQKIINFYKKPKKTDTQPSACVSLAKKNLASNLIPKFPVIVNEAPCYNSLHYSIKALRNLQKYEKKPWILICKSAHALSQEKDKQDLPSMIQTFYTQSANSNNTIAIDTSIMATVDPEFLK